MTGSICFVLLLGAAYRLVGKDAKENLAIREAVRKSVPNGIKARFDAGGLTAQPFNLDALWARIDLPHPLTR